MSKKDPLSKLSIPVNSVLMSNNNQFIGVVQGKRFKKSEGGDTPIPESIISALEDVKNSVADISGTVSSLVDSSTEIINNVSSITANVEDLSAQVTNINDTVGEISTLLSITTDIEDLSDQVIDINNNLEGISSAISSINLEEYFPLTGYVTVSGDVAFNGNVTKNVKDIYSGIYLLEETDELVANMLSVYSVSFFVKNANSVNDIFTDESCKFVLKIRESEEVQIEEEEVASVIYGEDIFENKFVSVTFNDGINAIRIQDSIENNEIQIFANVNGSEIILKALQKSEINVSYGETEENLNIATEKDISVLKDEISGAVENKFNELDQVFVEKNKDIYMPANKHIYQTYEAGLNQRYITAKDLDEYDAFGNSRDEINALLSLDNTDDPVLSGIIDRLNQILTILKNN